MYKTGHDLNGLCLFLGRIFVLLVIILAYVNCCVHSIDECVRDISTIVNKCIYFVEKHLFMKRKT